MKPRVLLLVFAVLAVAGGALYKFSPQSAEPQPQAAALKEVEESQTAKETEEIINKELSALPKPAQPRPIETKKEVSTPGPLVSPTPAPPAAPPAGGPEPSPPPPVGLTSAGIISQTNVERKQNGVSTLSTNGTLNATALAKANDMCQKQYFAHVSPSGVGAGDLADSFGYNYLAIGENLAYGPFGSDIAVVEAWMNSPGHRANILNPKFIEMGAAAVPCILSGKNTWLAVQHFGKPTSLCPKPDSAFLQTINQKKDALTYLKLRITNLKGEIETTDWADSSYAGKVDSYNALVKEYNALLAETRTLITQYNSQVSSFNVCAAS